MSTGTGHFCENTSESIFMNRKVDTNDVSTEIESSKTSSKLVFGESSMERKVNTSTNSDTSGITNTLQEHSKTDRNCKSISDMYVCKDIETEYNIKPTSVQMQNSDKIFITSAESNQAEENKELEPEEECQVYGMEHVPIFDEFVLTLDDDDDYE